MARYTKADAARQLGISRTTLYKLINQGKLSATPDGFIDATELVRAAPHVDTLKERTRTPTSTDHMDSNTSGNEHHGHPVDTIHEQQWTEGHVRQWTSTDALVAALRDQVQDLREQRQMLREDLHQAREHARLLLDMLQAERTRYDRLLEAPRPVSTSPPRRDQAHTLPGTTARGEMRQRIVTLLREYPDGLSPAHTRQTLGVEKDLGATMKAMERDGLLRRLAVGRYTAATMKEEG